MAVQTDWTLGFTGSQGTYYFTRIDGPNAETVFTNKFPFELHGPYVEVTLYSADGANFDQQCSLDVYAVVAETNGSDVHTEKDIEIEELIAAAAQGAEPVLSNFQVEKYPALAYKFGVESGANASNDGAVIGVFIPNLSRD